MGGRVNRCPADRRRDVERRHSSVWTDCINIGSKHLARARRGRESTFIFGYQTQASSSLVGGHLSPSATGACVVLISRSMSSGFSDWRGFNFTRCHREKYFLKKDTIRGRIVLT
jgi:hypothetical protein